MSQPSIGRVILATTFILTGGCGNAPGSSEEDLGEIRQLSRCDTTWDAPDVELYDGSTPGFPASFVARYQGAFGRHCSGTLIGPNLFLTVGHSSCPVAVGESVGFNCQISASNPTPPDPDAAAAARCSWYTATSMVSYSATLDASVSILDGDPGLTYGWVQPTPRPLSAGDPLAIFQHPNGQGRRKVVGFGDVVGISSTDVSYRIDTTGGSSGAGVLNQQGLLVAVHRASGCTDSGGANHGVPMTYIFEEVPEVRRRVVASWVPLL